MEAQVYKIGKLIIENGDYILEISSAESKLLSELNISSSSEGRKWRNSGKCSLETDIYNIDNRSGIWFEQGEPIFFSKVSLFEETEYYFEIKNNNQNIKKIEVENEFKENIQTKLGTKKLFSIFFESIEKWITDARNRFEESDDNYSIIIKEVKESLWSINFKAYTGRLKLRKEIIGSEANDIEVIPKKLSRQNYTQMLDGLNIFISQIFFKNKSPTQIPATRDYLPSEIKKTKLYDCPTYLLLRAIMEEIDIYFYGIMNRLNSKFYYFDELKEMHEIRDASNIDYVQTISNPNNLILLETTGVVNVAHFSINGDSYTFNRIHSYSKKLSFDTPENRFVKFILKLLFNELDREEIKKFFVEAEKYNTKSELNDYLTDLTEMIHFLEREDIKDLQVIPYSSQILQKNSYYRRFLQYFIWLQNPTAFNVSNLFFIDIKPMYLLYELYCLYMMKNALDSLVYENIGLINFPDEITEKIKICENDDSSEFRRIDCIKFNYCDKEGNIISLIFKPENLSDFKKQNLILNSYSGSQAFQKPDFLLVKWDNTQIGKYEDKNLIVIIDAKYRAESSDLWIKMHFYKDALNAIGAIFINPFTRNLDKKYSGRLLTPYGDLTNDHKPNEKANQYGFVSGINLLGLREDTMQEIEFKKIFRTIIKTYFNST